MPNKEKSTSRIMNKYEWEGLSSAVIFATEFHRGQTDKQGMPYILHPLKIMWKFTDPKLMVVAVLHDVVEDTNCTLGTIELEFGVEIRHAIDAITHRAGESNNDYWKRCSMNDLAYEVKLEDIYHNLVRNVNLPLGEERTRLHKKYTLASEKLKEYRESLVDKG